MLPQVIKFAAAILLGMLLGAAVSLWVLSNQNRELGYGPSDATVVQIAMAEWSKANHQSDAQAKQRHYPVVIHFPSKTCVELRLKTGIAGLAPVYCINPTDGKIIETYTDGE